MYRLVIFILLATGLTRCQASWYDAEQMELFDLVEEVKQNFYEFMELNEVKNRDIQIESINLSSL